MKRTKIKKVKNKKKKKKENKIIKEKNADEEVIGKITGMILGIQNNEEIIDILKSPSRLEERIKEAYVLFEKNK